MEIIFRVGQLDEINWGEGRMREKSPAQTLPPALGGKARKRDLPGHWRDPGECRVPGPGGLVSGERELSAEPTTAGRSSQKTTETTSVFDHVVTTGDTDHENIV